MSTSNFLSPGRTLRERTVSGYLTLGETELLGHADATATRSPRLGRSSVAEPSAYAGCRAPVICPRYHSNWSWRRGRRSHSAAATRGAGRSAPLVSGHRPRPRPSQHTPPVRNTRKTALAQTYCWSADTGGARTRARDIPPVPQHPSANTSSRRRPIRVHAPPFLTSARLRGRQAVQSQERPQPGLSLHRLTPEPSGAPVSTGRRRTEHGCGQARPRPQRFAPPDGNLLRYAAFTLAARGQPPVCALR